MALPSSAFQGGIIGTKTAAIGTVWYAKIDPYSGGASFTVLAGVNVTNGNTVNNLTFMRPIGRTTAAAAATTASNTVTLTADPGPTGNLFAANDLCITANADGTFTQYVCGAFNATTKVLTVVGANLAVNIAAGAKVFNFGINTDTDPVTGLAHPVIPSIAANTTGPAFAAAVAGFLGAVVGDPLLIYCPNATGQSVLNYAEFAYDNGY